MKKIKQIGIKSYLDHTEASAMKVLDEEVLFQQCTVVLVSCSISTVTGITINTRTSRIYNTSVIIINAIMRGRHGG